MTVLNYDLRALATQAYGSFTTDPADTWNSPAINVRREWNYKDDAAPADLWLFSIVYGSANSALRNEASAQAAEALAANLVDLVDTMRDMRSRVDEFEAAYQVNMDALRAQSKAEQAAAAQAEADDSRVTKAQAEHAIATMAADVRHGGKTSVTKVVRKRGRKDTVYFGASRTWGNAVQFKLGGQVISKARLAERLQAFAEITEFLD
jgi:hypothetical protein